MALSFEAVYPTVVPVREALTKGVAPSDSMLRQMTAEDSPDPDLNAMYLLASDAPDSEMDSEADPALGNVSEMVEVEEAVSDTMVSPFARVVTEAELADAAAGDVEGIPGNSSTGVRRAENSLLPEERTLREAVDAARTRAMVFYRIIN
mmetsp:Transcript_28857/g.42759  ORF Transcript_28857/g.42759 Transcript_28857/m.42759 type:complete len:149 (+) Transcript_28857:1143-1589(+)